MESSLVNILGIISEELTPVSYQEGNFFNSPKNLLTGIFLYYFTVFYLANIRVYGKKFLEKDGKQKVGFNPLDFLKSS